MLTRASRRYMSSTSSTSRGDQKRSAIAAVRGQMRESIVSGPTHSPHIVASPPRMCAASASRQAAVGRQRIDGVVRRRRVQQVDVVAGGQHAVVALLRRVERATSGRATSGRRFPSADPAGRSRPTPSSACRASAGSPMQPLVEVRLQRVRVLDPALLHERLDLRIAPPTACRCSRRRRCASTGRERSSTISPMKLSMNL